jgi:hypothetical protein
MLWKPEVHYRVQMNPVHTLTHNIFKIHVNNILPSTRVSSKWSFPYVPRTCLQYLTNAAEARVHTQVSPCMICSGQSGTGTSFSPSTSVFPVSIIPPLFRIHLCIIWGRGNSNNNSNLTQRQRYLFQSVLGQCKPRFMFPLALKRKWSAPCGERSNE